MFAGDDAVHFTALIQAPVEGQASAWIKAVVTRAVAHQASHALPHAQLVAQHALSIVAAATANQLGLGGDQQHLAGDGPDALPPGSGVLLQQAGFGQGTGDSLEGLFLLVGIQGRAGLQGARQPVLVPGGAPFLADQLLEMALTAVAGEKDWPGRRATELGGVQDLVELEGVLRAAAEVLRPLLIEPHQFLNGDGPSLAQLMQHPHHQLAQLIDRSRS